MKKIYCIIIIELFFFSGMFAQSWVNLAGGLDFQARVLCSDSISGKLFVGGNFSTADGHNSFAIAAWDGSFWDTLDGGLTNFVRTITRYQNYVYVGGAFTYLHSSPNSGLVNGFTRWNGTSFDSVGTFHNNNNSIGQLIEHNNLLYCYGGFDSINSIYSPNIAAWDGNNCIPVGFNRASGSWIMCFYQNELYIAGNFIDNTGTLYGFAKWNGSSWQQVGTAGGLVASMAVYHNELYIGGHYMTGPSQYLIRYNGTNFSMVGNDIHGRIDNLRVIDDKLYAVGIIDTAGGMPVSNIAVWDGSNWSAFSNDTFDNGVSDIAVFNGELYVTGGFYMINSDTINYIAKYDGWHLGEELPSKKQDGVKVYPNPVSNTLTIESRALGTAQQEKNEVSIYNVLGEKILSQNFLGQKHSLNVSAFAKGIYFVEVKTEKAVVTRRIVKM